MPFERWSQAPRRLPLLFLAVTLSDDAGIRIEQVSAGSGVREFSAARVSQDGRYITFEDWTARLGANLAVRDLKTGENRLLTHEATAGDWAENPVASPDGKLYRPTPADTPLTPARIAVRLKPDTTYNKKTANCSTVAESQVPTP